MLRSRLLVAILLLSAFLFSCAGEDGATGPAGKNGNANVIMYEFGPRTSTGSISYTFEIEQAVFERSLILGYYNPQAISDTTTYYPIPGLGPWANYLTRSYTYISGTDPSRYTYLVTLMNPNGTDIYATSTVFSKLKLFVVPASVLSAVTSRGLLDLSDYNAVTKYLNLPE